MRTPAMIAVIFEVSPKAERYQDCLDIAAELRLELAEIDGFMSVERFESLSNKERILSVSFWRDEQAVLAWRNLDKHRVTQKRGRTNIFTDYRLRVAAVMRDYGMVERVEAPVDSRAVHDRPEPLL